MKIGFIISMYDEIDVVKNSIKNIKLFKSPIVIIQSDPKDSSKVITSDSVDFYEKLPDLAGSKEEYLKERSGSKGATTPVKSVTRNYKHAFDVSKKFDVEWWIVILGDVLISNLTGIEKLIQQIISDDKSIGITRAVGQIFMDNDNKPTRIQHKNTTDFMPQFFIVKSNLIQDGLFSKFQITNKFATEQCLGDEVNRFCSEHNTNFHKICYIISDYAYPQFISGVQYNPDRIKMPRYVDGFINMMRRFRTKHS